MDRLARFAKPLIWASIFAYGVALLLPAVTFAISISEPVSDPTVVPLPGWGCLAIEEGYKAWFWWANPALFVSWIFLFCKQPIARVFTVAALCGSCWFAASMSYGDGTSHLMAGGWMWLLSMLLADFAAVLTFAASRHPKSSSAG